MNVAVMLPPLPDEVPLDPELRFVPTAAFTTAWPAAAAAGELYTRVMATATDADGGSDSATETVTPVAASCCTTGLLGDDATALMAVMADAAALVLDPKPVTMNVTLKPLWARRLPRLVPRRTAARWRLTPTLAARVATLRAKLLRMAERCAVAPLPVSSWMRLASTPRD